MTDQPMSLLQVELAVDYASFEKCRGESKLARLASGQLNGGELADS